ncbi:MAG: addiction module protein [Plectolyngbya sp. WJT66-NPBG17]|jgi:hypothetical protein|nr:addiction module protein [Plectolyngbya sp. WJT66-NPBG17]MBW4526862.1 addiction module protein [Phormidium tanganyikae FI6-MK23]
MTETAEKLKIGLSQLSVKERAEPAYFLIHSLDEEADSDVESTWNNELMRRVQEIRSTTGLLPVSLQIKFSLI